MLFLQEKIIFKNTSKNRQNLQNRSPNILVTHPNTGIARTQYYGFQGQEKDDEVSGKGNSYTAEFWQYDSRLGRRWNIDPVVKYHESPYAAFANNPVWFIDPSGADTIAFFVYQKKWPNVFNTHLIGIAKNSNLLNTDGSVYLDYDPSRSNARSRAYMAKGRKINPAPLLFDYDEFPYSSTKQGGSNAGVNLVPKRENRSHGGALGSIVRMYKMKMGDVFKIILTPDENSKKVPEPEKVPQPFVRPEYKPKPVGGYPGQGIGDAISGLIEKLSGVKIYIPDPVPVPNVVRVPVSSPRKFKQLKLNQKF